MEKNSDAFKLVIWFNLFIGIYNLYLYNQGEWWFNFAVGSLNIGAWVFNRSKLFKGNN